MRLSEHFTLEELTFSQTAVREGLDNTPDEEIVGNLRRLVETVLEPARQKIGVPILVTSGYRSPEVNAWVGGARNSYHMYGCAADIIAPSLGEPYELAQEMIEAGLPYDKLILEFGRWVHVQVPKHEDIPPRRRVLTARRVARQTVYEPGLLKTEV